VSDVSDKNATRMLATVIFSLQATILINLNLTFRPSQHVMMVWRVANMSATSRACRARGIWVNDMRQTDKPNGKVVGIFLVTRTLRVNCCRGT